MIVQLKKILIKKSWVLQICLVHSNNQMKIPFETKNKENIKKELKKEYLNEMVKK